MQSEQSISADYPVRTWGLIALLCGIPAFVLFVMLGRQDRALVAMASVSIIVFTVRVSWHSRRRIWFVPLVVLMALVHTWVVVSIHFGRLRYTLLYVGPPAFVDFIVFFAMFWYAEKWSKGHSGRELK